MKQITGSTLDDRGLPEAIDVERFILGSILIRSVEFGEIRTALEVSDFALEKHRTIWVAMLQLYERGLQVDRVMLGRKLLDDGKLESVDGLGYLVSLDEGMPRLANIDGYVKVVRDKGIMRKVIYLAEKIKSEAILGQGNPAELLLKAEKVLSELGLQATSDETWQTPLQIIEKAGGLQKYLERGRGLGVPTGFDQLNALTCGFRRKNLIILGATTGGGKSTLARLLALNAASAGFPVGFINLEMANDEALDGLICAEGGINTQIVRRGLLTQRDAVRAAAKAVAELPLYFRDKAGATVDQIHGEARKLKAERGIQFLIVDYLQLMSSGKRSENRTTEVGAIARGLKMLAQDLDIPVLALSQIKRLDKGAPTKKNRDEQSVDDGHDPQNPRPTMNDLRESGDVENSANLIMLIWSKRIQERLQHYPTELIIPKQRGGETGMIPFQFEKSTGRFFEVAQAGRVEA